MQTWAKRGIQTALVTGGLLMLGTGIASANEKVDPDSPAGPLDLTASVPIDIKDNAIGTPGGQVNLPGYQGEVSTKPVTDVVNKAAAPVQKAASPAAKAAAPVTAPVQKAVTTAGQAASKVNGLAAKGAPAQRTAAQQAPTAPSVEPTDDPFMGNKIVGNVALPIQITGNAVGVLGDAEVSSDAEQTYAHNSDVSTSGAGGGLAGNVVALNWALPVQISGNAGGLGGSGKSSGSASQSAATTGDIETDGTNGGLAGNVVSPQFASPVQLSGNALGWFLGHAETDFDAESEADSGGYIVTHGDSGAGAGNVVGAPIGLPVRVANDAVSWGGDADATGSSEVEANAGDTTPGLNDIPSYIQTDGDNSFLSGNIAQPQGALLASVTGTAAAWIGNSLTEDTASEAEMTAGGFSSTTGQDAAGSGNIADLPVALPVEVFGVGGTWIGNAHAKGHDNTTSAAAGDGTYSNGDGSVVSANTVTGQVASTVEAFGIGGSWIGNASGHATEEKVVDAGGYNGTRGNDSGGSGNLVQVPIAAPVEVFGVGGSWIGQGIGTAEETKVVKGGGGGNTEDDNGFLAANLISTPVSLPAQAFGIGGTWIGNGFGEATADTISQAGDDVHANGEKGTGAGNIGFVPVSLPVQLHGIGASWIGNAGGTSDNLTDSLAGGDASTTGEGGSVAGNVVQAPVGAAAGVFGLGASWVGVVSGEAANDVVSEAGGDTTTNGDGGSIAGNVLSAQALPVAEVFGSAASLTAVATGTGENSTDVASGGDITTSGVGGALSGDIFDVPVAAVAQVFGVAGSVGGVAHAVADNTTTGTVGGETTTAGAQEALSGLNHQLPLGALVQIYDIPLSLAGVVSTTTTNLTDISVAGDEPMINIPITGAELPATGLPALSRSVPGLPGADGLPELGGLPVGGAGLPELGGLPVAGGLPAAGALPLAAGALPGLGGGLPEVSGLPVGDAGLPQLNTLPVQVLPTELTTTLPGAGERADLPEAGLPELPGLPELGSPQLPELPTSELPTTMLPALDAGSLAPQADLPALAQLDSGSVGAFQGVLDGFNVNGKSLGI
ncbi:beta strand repeat-containing protein [Prauserella muralis]|uniref:Uncharacterized protein n=1 Tax=Prauserella muralis TaxID=588067 RepID=A0A2V4B8P5_9PSEU|nr:hypothetical protein [Prauserella muralis]PXY31638.1 hypothetical protein BAY60_04530 [Prauserella muralis]TWE13996.1 hypothetical protein FHX69_6130 [Prauserella muralis]